MPGLNSVFEFEDGNGFNYELGLLPNKFCDKGWGNGLALAIFGWNRAELALLLNKLMPGIVLLFVNKEPFSAYLFLLASFVVLMSFLDTSIRWSASIIVLSLSIEF